MKVASLRASGSILLGTALGACVTPDQPRPRATVRYVGSSTVGTFVRDAEPVYGAIDFEIDTRPESAGGEQAILEGLTDLAGVARVPGPETMRAGVAATLIGKDAISVIVNASNPVSALSLSDLRAIFTGKLGNWREAGGPDLPIRAFIVGADSATRKVFQALVMGGEEYEGCEEIQPDAAIIAAVENEPGGVGQISFSFLEGAVAVRPVVVEGERPSVTNLDYPITRPLYLLRREGNPAVDAFVAWTQTEEGQRVVMRHFVGTRVVGSVQGAPEAAERGTLIVYTETYPVYDGGIYYYPHRPYEIRDRLGTLLRRVPNHRGDNDESAMRVELPPGTYLIRVETSGGQRPEFFATVERGAVTELDVLELLESHR